MKFDALLALLFEWRTLHVFFDYCYYFIAFSVWGFASLDQHILKCTIKLNALHFLHPFVMMVVLNPFFD